MPIPATVEPSYCITFEECLWLGAALIIILAALYVVIEFIKIVRKEV